MSTLSNSYGFRENCDLISGSRNLGLQGIEREGGGRGIILEGKISAYSEKADI